MRSESPLFQARIAAARTTRMIPAAMTYSSVVRPRWSSWMTRHARRRNEPSGLNMFRLPSDPSECRQEERHDDQHDEHRQIDRGKDARQLRLDRRGGAE